MPLSPAALLGTEEEAGISNGSVADRRLMAPSPHLSNGDERTLKGTRCERDSGREGERQGKRQGLWP